MMKSELTKICDRLEGYEENTGYEVLHAHRTTAGWLLKVKPMAGQEFDLGWICDRLRGFTNDPHFLVVSCKEPEGPENQYHDPSDPQTDTWTIGVKLSADSEGAANDNQ